jgi:teichuronic acid biosynthesis glycosyltransferase TuaC
MPRSEARRLLQLPLDRVIALFVGSLIPEKGVRELADAVLQLGDPFMAVFVGAGPFAEYRSRDPRAPGRLDYRGERPHADVARYLSAADVLVLPSYGEGLPTVLVEAGSMGVPVIASAVGGIPELLGNDRGKLLSDVSVASIAAALESFVNGRDRAYAAALNLRDHVLQWYDADRNAAKLLEVYRSVSHAASSER